MNVCILGNGLISLSLAKTLVNQGIFVDLFTEKKIKKADKSRTIGITKSNIDFFNKNILNIEKILWKINKIEIYSKNLKNEKILNFEKNSKQLFSTFRNYKLYDYLNKELKKDKFFNFKKFYNNKKLNTDKYELIINCDVNSLISKKFFYKKINKDYKSFAYTTIIKHKHFQNNNIATQTFTQNGPIAFLPISSSETSIVYSIKGSGFVNLDELIKKYNDKYSIIKIGETSKFELKSSSLRSYKHGNILAFGDMLHKLHPLAGQGFNMCIRDIELLLDLIKFKIEHGLPLDRSICSEFEDRIRHKNYFFLTGVDFIYEFFNLESKLQNPLLIKSLQSLGKNKSINNFFTKFADKGVII